VTARRRTTGGPHLAAPVVKAAGGKTRLLGELVPRMPARFRRYYEPFAGGAALFFRLAPARAVLSDANADLMAVYRAIAEDVEAVIARLAQHRAAHAERHYYAIRDAWNRRDPAWPLVDRAAAFVYLNKTCFNGLWRVNRAGLFNVPLGRYADPAICVPEALRASAAALRGATLREGDYGAAIADARRGDFVYCDPPYDGTFGAYTADGFDDAAQAALAFAVRTLVARGCQVMVSNADTPRIRALYAGMRIDVVRCARAINCDGRGRGAVDEVIVTAGYEPAITARRSESDTPRSSHSSAASRGRSKPSPRSARSSVLSSMAIGSDRRR